MVRAICYYCVEDSYHLETGKSKPRASQLQSNSAARKMGKKAVAAKLAEGQEVSA
jgi:cell wall-associated NlpC family hydrolase